VILMNTLRRRRNLQPRVSNTLAAFSLLLLLVSTLIDENEPAALAERQIAPVAAELQSAMEQDALPALQTAARQTIKVSLMLFRHN
jgi:hypothetical protein